MKIWHDKGDLVERLAQARRDARDTAPRSGGNDALEAAMFFAMMHELDRWAGEQVDEPTPPVLPVDDPFSAPPPQLEAPAVVTEPPPKKPLLPEVDYANAG